MKPERWQEVREVLDQALTLPPSERVRYLDRACLSDLELRDEVDSLLRSHEDAGTVFLNKPAVDLKSAVSAAPAVTRVRVGHRIGVYQIVEEIGHGGMGEVYRAIRADGQYDKQVAIKLVRTGFDTAAVLERFRHERQILASLDHPNIARLYDGGTTEDGIPYLVMELIDGTPIDQYCEQNDLRISERLQLFNRVCGAVQYAHQRLVIHRDIKPSNVLVTADGIPKLLDFGIAKILDSSAGLETTLLRPMTPEYASPEQIRGEAITTATDVYSLGVVFYKLLTGRSPYSEKTRTQLEFAKVICEFEPARPSSALLRHAPDRDPKKLSVVTVGEGSREKLRRCLKGDLDNIVLKALRKEPARRYASIEQLAEDIRRHLQGLPVTATPDSASYRVGKFLRRHKAGVAAAALVALTVTGGVAATLREARIAVQQRARAERRFNDVRQLANSFLFEFDEAIKNLPGSTPARALVVRRALEYLDGMAPEARGDLSLQLEIAAAYQKVAEVQGDPTLPNLGDSKGALETSRKSLAILESLRRAEPGNQDVLLSLARNHQQISDVLAFSGDDAGTVEHSGEALKIYESLAGSLSSDPNFRTARVVQTYRYANQLQDAGRLDQAVGQYHRAVELSQALVAANPSDRESKFHLATSLDGLGNVLQEQGNTASALENRRKGLVIREELNTLDPNNAQYRRQLAFSHHNLGLSLVIAGDLASALGHFRTELALFESLSAADPKDVQGRRNRSLAHKQIGDVLVHNGDVRGALAQYNAALGIDRDLASIDPANSQAVLDMSFSEGKVGSVLGKLGQTREARAILRNAVARQESLVAKDSSDVFIYNHLANSYTLLANLLLRNADTNSAIDYYRKAVGARLAFSKKNPNSSMNRGALAECYTNLGKALALSDPDDALKQYSSAIALLEPLAASDRSNAHYRLALADALSSTGRLYAHLAEQEADASARLHHWTEAKSFYQRSQELWVELDQAGKLPLTYRPAIRESSSELARSNDSLAKLRQIH